MAKDSLIYRTCGVCDGDGVVTAPSSTPPYNNEDVECPECHGTGGVLWGWTEKV